LTDGRSSWEDKRSVLQQGAGFIGPLISLALPLLLSLVR
jgi:hypothetical protein